MKKLPKKLEKNKQATNHLSLEDAIRIQKKRVANRQRGYAKAVRRTIRNHAMLAGWDNEYGTYDQFQKSLPVYWGVSGKKIARRTEIELRLHKPKIQQLAELFS